MKRSYYVTRLRNVVSEYFHRKAYPVSRYSHILSPAHDWKNNIILPSVKSYIANQIQSRASDCFALSVQKYNGLSSQFCLFNLFGHFLATNTTSVLKPVIELSGLKINGTINAALFEMIDRSVFNENQRQPTSIDLALTTDQNEKIFIEYKYTEIDFGVCSLYKDGDCSGQNPVSSPQNCYFNTIGRKYHALMKKYSLYRVADVCPFVEFYQAYRVLLFSLEHGGSCLLMHDSRNPALYSLKNDMPHGRFYRFISMLPSDIASRVYILSIQDAVGYLDRTGKYPWIVEFREKYL